MKRFGDYTVVHELARGGQGAVYVARDPAGREVALKLLHSHVDAQRRFQLEAEALAQLRHPNIVTVHAFGHTGGSQYLVMDLVEGESLQARLKRDGPLEPRQAAALTQTLAEALAHAHGQSVLHRDLKPHNVLLGADGRPRLTDFGLAARLEDQQRRLTQTGEILGTPGYMAPEQADGKYGALDVRTDVYGLGATLYALLTGRPPFQGASHLQVLGMLVSRPPAPPSSLRPGIDAALEAICLRCLEKSPAARPPSAADLADELARYLAGDQPPTRRLGALAIVLTLIVGVALALFTRSDPAPKDSPAATPTPTVSARPPAPGRTAAAAPSFASGTYKLTSDRASQVLQVKGRAMTGAEGLARQLQRTHRGIEVHFLDRSTLVAVSDRYRKLLLFRGGVDAPSHEISHGLDEVFATASTRAGAYPLLAVGGVHQATAKGGDPGRIVVFQLKSEQLTVLRSFDLGHSIEALAFSPSENQLAFGTAGMRVGVVNISDGMIQLETHPKPRGVKNAWVKTLAFSRDGRELLSGNAASETDPAYSLIRWGVTQEGLSQRGERIPLHQDAAQCAISVPEGYLVGTRMSRILLLRPTEPIKPKSHSKKSGAVAYSARLRALALRGADLFSAAWSGEDNAQGQLHRWERATGEFRGAVPLAPGPARPVSLAVSPDGRQLAVGHSGPEVLIEPSRRNQLGRVEVLAID